MPSPFPGMDPWIEHPALWPDVHNGLIGSIRLAPAPLLPEGSFIGVEERMVISAPGRPPRLGAPRGRRCGCRARSTEPEPPLELNALLHHPYDLARYHRRVDYTRPPVRPLAEADAAWARDRLAARAEAAGPPPAR